MLHEGFKYIKSERDFEDFKMKRYNQNPQFHWGFSFRCLTENQDERITDEWRTKIIKKYSVYSNYKKARS